MDNAQSSLRYLAMHSIGFGNAREEIVQKKIWESGTDGAVAGFSIAVLSKTGDR
jgi:hypothetical protein